MLCRILFHYLNLNESYWKNRTLSRRRVYKHTINTDKLPLAKLRIIRNESRKQWHPRLIVRWKRLNRYLNTVVCHISLYINEILLVMYFHKHVYRPKNNNILQHFNFLNSLVWPYHVITPLKSQCPTHSKCMYIYVNKLGPVSSK